MRYPLHKFVKHTVTTYEHIGMGEKVQQILPLRFLVHHFTGCNFINLATDKLLSIHVESGFSLDEEVTAPAMET